MPQFGAGAILINGGQTLLQRRSVTEHEPLTWCVFGGMSERQETPRQTMIREVFEESGIDVTGCHMWLTDTFHNERDTFRFHTYVVLLDDRLTPTRSPETHEAAWFPLGDVPDTLWNNIPRPLQSGFAKLVQSEKVAKDICWRITQQPVPFWREMSRVA